jgi:hypothetical protein
VFVVADITTDDVTADDITADDVTAVVAEIDVVDIEGCRRQGVVGRAVTEPAAGGRVGFRSLVGANDLCYVNSVIIFLIE